MRFNLKYLLLTLALLAIEIIIARYAHDDIIRPFFGDFLVVILIHCFVMTFFKINLMTAALGVLLFAYAVEISQYYHLVYVLGWGNSKFAKIIMGTYFSWMDMLMYTGGIILVVVIELLSGKPLQINRK